MGDYLGRGPHAILLFYRPPCGDFPVFALGISCRDGSPSSGRLSASEGVSPPDARKDANPRLCGVKGAQRRYAMDASVHPGHRAPRFCLAGCSVGEGAIQWDESSESGSGGKSSSVW